MNEKLKKYLEKFNINYEEFKHSAVFTVEESKKIEKDKLIPGLHCKCLFLKDNNKKFYLVGMPANKKLDIKSLKNNLNVKKLHFASPEELKEKLKLTPGSVSIFGLINNKENDAIFLLDKEVWNAEKSGFHPNINTSTLVLSNKDLKKYFNSLNNEKKII